MTEYSPPTDRGFVLVRPDPPKGDQIVICAGVKDGQPVRPYAVHRHCMNLDIANDVQLVGDTTRWSTGVVQAVWDMARKAVVVRNIEVGFDDAFVKAQDRER